MDKKSKTGGPPGIIEKKLSDPEWVAEFFSEVGHKPEGYVPYGVKFKPDKLYKYERRKDKDRREE
jgi:hypothetical protein